MKNDNEVEITKYLCEKIPELNGLKREKKEKEILSCFGCKINEI
jgi:hypothetical protein